MNGYLIQGFVQYYNTGDFNGLTKGGIYLFHSTNQSIANTPVSDGILEVLPSKNTAGTEQIIIQRITAISSNEATGAIYIRSGRYASDSWSWINWITISTSGGTQTLDTEVTEHSQNPVTSAGIYDFVENQIVQATDPYIELYLSRTNNIIDSTLLMRFVNFQEAVPTTYAALVSSNDFKKALLNNVLVYMGAYGDNNTALACQGSLMSGNAYFPLPTNQYWYVCLTTTIIWQGEYTAFLTGYPIYDDGAWYLADANLEKPYWVDAVSNAITTAENYTNTKTTYTNPNGTTMTVGGIEKGTNFDNVPLTTIIHDLLYPYVPPTFSSVSTNIDISNGKKYEIYSSQSLTYVKPVYTPGSESLTSIKVGTSSGGSQIAQSSTVPASNTNFTFTAYNNVTRTTKGNFVIYVTLDDGTSNNGHAPVKSVSIPFTPFYYYALSQSGTTIPNNPTGIPNGVESVTVTTVYGDYLYLYSPETGKTKIQQYSMNMWNDVPTTNMGTKSLNINGTSMTYYVFRTPALVAGSGQFRVV